MGYLGYRALHSTGHLEYEGSATGIVMGIFDQLKHICQDPRVNSNRVGLFFDSGKSFREQIYPAYKKKRRDDRTEEEKAAIATLWQQVRVLREKWFPAIGLPCYRQTGLESDDLMVRAAFQILARGERCIIVTADGDLYQAIRDQIHWFDPGRSTYYTPETFEEVKGIAPDKWGEVKMLAGCKSDNVAGIPGIGETSAIKHLLGTLPTHQKKSQLIRSKRGLEIADLNRKLVILPHEKTKRVELKEPSWNAEAFWEMCQEFHLLSFLGHKVTWKKFFSQSGMGFNLRRRGEAYS